MADIKQAAKWMEQGKTVTRNDGYNLKADNQGDGLLMVECFDSDSGDELKYTIFVDDLLADDWEVVE